MTQDVTIRLRLDQGNLPQASTQAAQSLGKIGEAGQISARQTAAAMRTLPAQMTDVATQLAGGQNPLLILLQQGGQIKDQFGGIGPAIRGIGAAISPVAVGIGALAAVMGTFGLAAYQGAEESKAFNNTLLLSGNAAALTASRLEVLSQSVREQSKQTVGGARDIVVALAATGSVGAKALDSTALAVARLADITGKDSGEIAKDFAGMSNGVAKWAAEHNKAWNYITSAQYQYIRQLEEQGKLEEAMIVSNQALLKATASQTQNLGILQGAWKGVRDMATGAWDAMLNVGRDGTTRQQLDIAMSRLDAMGGNLQPKAREALEQRIQLLKEQLKLEGQQADARGRSASTNRAEIADLVGDKAGAKAGAGRREKPYLPGEFQVLDARDGMVAAAAYEKEQSRIDGFFNQALQAQEDRDAKRLTAETEFLDSLREATRRSAIELITDERERAEALVRLDQETADRRLAAKGLTPGALAEARSLNQQRAENEITKLSDKAGSSTYDDVRGALAAAFRDSSNPAKAFANALGNAIFTRVSAGLADALATAAVGKSGSGGLLGELLGLFNVKGGGRGTSGIDPQYTTGSPMPGFDMPGAGLATGTNFVPRDMLALVHRGEAIVPAKYNHGAAGGGGRMEVHYHVPAGQSPAAYAAALADNNARLEAKFAADLARPGRRMNNAMLAGA